MSVTVQSSADRRILNLGSGRTPIAGAVNLDVSHECNPDVVHDLRDLPWPFANDSFDELLGFDVIEHVPDTIATMEEIHRICRPSARVHFTTPHFSCANAFTDPTHCHQFGYFSFDYFTGEATHNHYTAARFAYIRRQLIFLPSRKNTLMRRLAKHDPAFYERHLCWIWPAWFISVELKVVK